MQRYFLLLSYAFIDIIQLDKKKIGLMVYKAAKQKEKEHLLNYKTINDWLGFFPGHHLTCI